MENTIQLGKKVIKGVPPYLMERKLKGLMAARLARPGGISMKMWYHDNYRVLRSLIHYKGYTIAFRKIMDAMVAQGRAEKIQPGRYFIYARSL